MLGGSGNLYVALCGGEEGFSIAQGGLAHFPFLNFSVYDTS
jgi:hypothetical protein